MNEHLYVVDLVEHQSLIDQIKVLKQTISTLLKRRRDNEDVNEEICRLRTLQKLSDIHMSGLNKRIDSLTSCNDIVQKQLEEMTTDRDDYAVLARLREKEMQVYKIGSEQDTSYTVEKAKSALIAFKVATEGVYLRYQLPKSTLEICGLRSETMRLSKVS